MKILQGSRILLTQYALVQFAGSEIVTLELVKYLISQGAHVTLYTLRFDDPIAHFFRELPEESLTIVARTNVELKPSQFDYIWVQHNILPPSIVRALSGGKKLPKMIFNHMSSFIPIEQPYLFGFENKLANLSLFNSEETRDNLIDQFGAVFANDTIVLPNPAPEEYIAFKRTTEHGERRILIVTNHPPEELSEAITLLRNDNITVDNVGMAGSPQLVTPELLDQYDAVISIGKTVQYCLVMGIPVYCYDHFGGPGFLNEKNYEKAAYHNFSGRGFRKKSAATIVKELRSLVEEASSYQNANLGKFQQAFSLHLHIQAIFARLATKDAPKANLTTEEVASYLSTELLVSQYVNSYYNSIRDVAEATRENRELSEKLSHALAEKARLEAFLNKKIIRAGVKVWRVMPKTIRKRI